MSTTDAFREHINEAYTFKGPSFVLGGAMLGDEAVSDALVKLPLGTLNRHGLIAGATGTGKTKTLQIIAEQLSQEGVPSLLMDIKGDLSGIAMPSPGHPKIDERHAAIGIPFEATGSPVELLSLSDEPGARLRATVLEFGPVLFSKMLALNDAQSGIVAVAFRYAEQNALPLLDLKDFRKILQYMTGEGKAEVSKEYGRISTASTGAIMRRIVELETQGAEAFFGEVSFDVNDLTRLDELGRGIVSILRLTDVQDRPKLFSTFMLQMLAEIYATFPEEGDLDRPKLVIFIDEAHLIFEEATDALLDQLEAIIKLIRSKGVGIFFVTQNPADIPSDILGQLGLKVQHALRAFTAKDRKAIKLASENYPLSDYYDIDQTLTELGTGEAFVTALDRKGRPTALVRTLLRAPASRMDVLTDKEIKSIVARSPLAKKYNKVVDRESAYEILEEKIKAANEAEHQAEMEAQREKGKKTSTRRRSSKEKSTFDKVLNSTTTRQIGNTVARELTRGLLGMLGIKSRSRSRKSNGWW
ncbi:helicase HerA-like domain-containing protein [Lewinella sp. 4G2]|uniref:helicase HerA-like domain-containing protein n=1 Tax=Lewinella sp. 4G2 TaxID=1803372 RepID=UPI0007B4D379|nr:helicase HerA-like domain-containing protein [Lewinella sp. 4G2]OAV46239.1 ATPase [Lewinella sp. 4G2]